MHALKRRIKFNESTYKFLFRYMANDEQVDLQCHRLHVIYVALH